TVDDIVYRLNMTFQYGHMFQKTQMMECFFRFINVMRVPLPSIVKRAVGLLVWKPHHLCINGEAKDLLRSPFRACGFDRKTLLYQMWIHYAIWRHTQLLCIDVVVFSCKHVGLFSILFIQCLFVPMATTGGW
ncbi:hypothetical protein ACJX0J_015158, partial [Zea mays]